MSTEVNIARIAPPLACPDTPTVSLRTQRFFLRAWLVLTDAVALGMAFLVAYWVRFGVELTTSPEVVPSPSHYLLLTVGLTAMSLLVFSLFRLYDTHSLLGGVSEYSRIFHACSTATVLLIFATFLVPQFVVSRIWVGAAWLLSFAAVASSRFLCRRMIYPLRLRGYFLTPAAIIGTNEEAIALAEDLNDWRASGLRIVGFVSEEPGTPRDLDLPVLGDVANIAEIVDENDLEDLVVAITALDRNRLLELCEDINPIPDVHLRLSSGLYELLATRLTVRTVGRVPLVSLNKVRLERGEAWAKALLEYSVAAGVLLAAAPLLLLIALMIKVDSPGPVLFRRRVLGVSGKSFDAFKFRTMRTDGHKLLARDPALRKRLETDFKLKEDPRVTRVGRWLRKYSLDELPQLLNVMKGEMGLVGPRMITSGEAEKYGRHKLNLLTVKPGITGLWQVSGRSDLSYDDRVQLDMYYIRNYSVWLDLQILFVQTLPAILSGRGAY